MIKTITTEQAPAAVGPYSQAVLVRGEEFLYVSGQIPIMPGKSQIETNDVAEQTRIVLQNLHAVLKAGGMDRNSVVKTTVFLKNMDDFSVVNEEYERFFSEHKPARACVEVARLPKDARVEVDAIAVR